MKRNTIEFEQVIEKGCGIDVHKETAIATVRGKGVKTETRTYIQHLYEFFERNERLA